MQNRLFSKVSGVFKGSSDPTFARTKKIDIHHEEMDNQKLRSTEVSGGKCLFSIPKFGFRHGDP
jgi:hypothetical protein